MIGFPKTVRIEDELLRKWVKRFPCCGCGMHPGAGIIDPSHVLTKGAGRPDTWWNLVPHCRQCHAKYEPNRLGFIDEHPRFWLKLKAMGWELTISVGKRRLWHPYLEAEDQS